jgi:hypothetical protein
MRKLLCGVIVAVFALAACNMTVGECWIEGQDGQGSGAGGGVIVPSQGGYGDVPPEPQGAGEPQPPDCNIVADTPCNEKCLKDYENAAAVCGKLANNSDRLTCQSAAQVAYTTCRNNCQQQEKTCTDMYVACEDKGWPCTRQTDWGMSLCAACRRDCQNGKEYYTDECYKCGFN